MHTHIFRGPLCLAVPILVCPPKPTPQATKAKRIWSLGPGRAREDIEDALFSRRDQTHARKTHHSSICINAPQMAGRCAKLISLSFPSSLAFFFLFNVSLRFHLNAFPHYLTRFYKRNLVKLFASIFTFANQNGR